MADKGAAGGKAGPAGGGKAAVAVTRGGGKKSGARLPSNVAPAHSVPSHMARRVEKGPIGLKGKWTHWPGVE